MRYFFILILFLFCGELISQTESFNYNLIHRNKEVGVLNAQKTISGDQIIYTSETKTTLSLIMDFVIIFDNIVKVKDGILEYAEMNVLVNKKNYGKTITRKNGTSYTMEEDGDEKVIKEFPITFSGSLLMFFEPKSEDNCYAEKTGEFHPLTHVGNQIYEKKDRKGRVNKYHYENGILKKAEIDAGLIEFQIVKVD